jgi:hypothetical protein
MAASSKAQAASFPRVVDFRRENARERENRAEDGARDRRTLASDPMRRAVPLIASALIGGIVVGAVLFIGNRVEVRVEIRRVPTDRAAESPTIASPDIPQSTDLSNPSKPSTRPLEDQGAVALLDNPREIIDRANKLIAAGKLHEAHDLYLQVLIVDPNDQESMRGLVRARRIKAGEDPAVLRQQANTYRHAISQGTETGEHYTPVAMDLLAKASLLAAAELEGSSAKAPISVPQPPVAESPNSPSETRATVPARPPTEARPAVPVARSIEPPKPQSTSPKLQPAKPLPTTAKAQPIQPKPQPRAIKPPPVRPKPQAATSKPQGTSTESQRTSRRNVVRRPTAPAPAKPAVEKPPSPPASLTVESEPPVDMNEPFVTITVGPIASGVRASSITSELTVAGYVARMRRGGAAYLITMGPYRRSVAERIASRIRARFGQGVTVSFGPSS